MRILISALAMTVLVFASPQASADDKDKAVEKELAKLQGLYGSYHANFSHTDGKEIFAQPLTELVKTHRIEGNKWLLVDAKGKATGQEAIITLDVSSSPKQIQFTYTRKGEKGKPDEQVRHYGIYEASEGGLMVHWGTAENIGGTKPAPKQFLELGKPIKGVDGLAINYSRIEESQAEKPAADKPPSRLHMAVAVGLDAKGKLLLRDYTVIVRQPAFPPKAGDGPERFYGPKPPQAVALIEVKIVTAGGEQLDVAALRERLKKEQAVVLASYGQPPAAIYLDALKPDTIVFIFAKAAPEIVDR
jgi:uncharacterized protein (TIGR03067 family)